MKRLCFVLLGAMLHLLVEPLDAQSATSAVEDLSSTFAETLGEMSEAPITVAVVGFAAENPQGAELLVDLLAETLRRHGRFAGYQVVDAAEKSARIATRIFEHAIESQPMQVAFLEVGGSVAQQVTPVAADLLARIYEAKLACTYAFTARRQGINVSDAFLLQLADPTSSDGSVELSAAGFDGDGTRPRVDVDVGRRLGRIIAEEIATYIAERILRRIAGKVAARLIPVFGTVRLIADGFRALGGSWIRELGTLLKSYENLSLIRDEYAESLRLAIGEQFREGESRIQQESREQYERFQSFIEPTLTLAESDETFGVLVAELNGRQVLNLDRVRRTASEEKLLAAAQAGTLEILLGLPRWQPRCWMRTTSRHSCPSWTPRRRSVSCTSTGNSSRSSTRWSGSFWISPRPRYLPRRCARLSR